MAGGGPKAEARLRVAEQEALTAKNLIAQLIDEELCHGIAGVGYAMDEESIYFLLDQAQSSLAKARSHVLTYYEERKNQMRQRAHQ